MENKILYDILNIIYIIEEDILIPNGIQIVDNRKWIPIWHNNKLGFISYTTDEELQKIYNDYRFFGVKDTNGKEILTTYKELGINKDKSNLKKKEFNLQL